MSFLTIDIPDSNQKRVVIVEGVLVGVNLVQ